MFSTTAIYSNRIEDKNKLFQILKLEEQGNHTTEFYYKVKTNNIDYKLYLIAKGYERIVFGDHGPYIEFKKDNIKIELDSKFGILSKELPSENNSIFYYYWLCPIIKEKFYMETIQEDMDIINQLDLKIYWQIKPVKDLPNAPKRDDGKKSNFYRKEGYADYKRDFYYINPYDLYIKH